MIPSTCVEHSRPQCAFSLQGADGSRIATYGVRSSTLNIGLRHNFRWVFFIANDMQPILGADFLQHFGLVVDMWHRTLSDLATCLSIDGFPSDLSLNSPGLSHVKQDSSTPFLSLLSEFPSWTQACAADRLIKHDVVHHIETTGPPVSARTRHLAPEHLRISREEFDHMLELRIIRPSSSSWSSALHMVPKHTPGDWRLPCSEQGDRSRSVTCPPLAGFHRLVAGNHDFQPHRFIPSLPSDPSGIRGCAKNCNHHALWAVSIRQDAFRPS